MTISIIHPSRGRPDMAFQIAQKWINTLSKNYLTEFILSVDTSDSNLEKYKNLFENLIKPKEVSFEILVSDNKSAIEAINKAASRTKNNLIVVISDDFDCFNNWDVSLVENLKDKNDFVVKTSDGIQDRLITLPIMDRKYYERFGYVYYPEYEHMFCDTEMTDVGHILGKVIDLRGLRFTHNHYIVGLAQKDAINEKNDKTWNQGELLYNNRKQINFNL